MRALAAATFLLTTPAFAADPPIAAFQAGSGQGGEPLSLDVAFRTAIQHSPLLAELAEAVPQVKAAGGKAWALITPQASIGAQFRVNDREIAFDPAEGFDTSALTDGFTGLYENLGFVYGELFEAGMIDGDECNEIAVLNGFADCAALTAGFLNGEDLTDDGGEQPAMEPTIIQPKTQAFLSATLTWPLNPRVVPMTQATRHGVRAAELTVEKARADLLLGVVRAFSASWTAQEALRILRHGVDVAKAHEKDVRALLAAGMVTQDNLLRAELEVHKIERQLRDAEAGLRMARRALSLAMGVPPDSFGPVHALPDIALPGVNIEEMRVTAAESRPDRLAAESQALSARAVATDAAMQFLPVFALSAQWTTSDQSQGFDGKKSSAWLGLGVQLPIWDGGIALSNVRESAARKRQAQAHVLTVRQQVTAEVLNAWDSWLTAKDAVPIAERELALASEVLRLVEVRYKAGTARQVEVLDAQVGERSAELSLLRARAIAAQAAAELMAAGGRIQEIAGGL